jgi:translation initiation factor IF-1
MKTEPRTTRRPPRRGLRYVVLILFIAAVAASCASAGGSRERGGAETPAGPLRGEVTAVRTLSDGAAELTVRQPDDSEVYVEIPARLARSIRIQEGDRILVEDRRMARDGERLRVQTLQIERGREPDRSR